MAKPCTFGFIKMTESMKFGVVVFPGSNCDRDMMDALRDDLGQEVLPLWHKDKDLSAFSTNDCIVYPVDFLLGIISVAGRLPGSVP
jgi:phosphoribosylformylglycinamidine (FGAM) synthase-like amidotransferase family enzyme